VTPVFRRKLQRWRAAEDERMQFLYPIFSKTIYNEIFIIFGLCCSR
jgi:hypothetical protein